MQQKRKCGHTCSATHINMKFHAWHHKQTVSSSTNGLRLIYSSGCRGWKVRGKWKMSL